MDKKTEHELNKINQSIPSNLAQNTTKKVVDTEAEEAAKAALNDPKIDRKGKEKVRQLIDQGSFRQETTEINEQVVKKIDDHNTREVKRAIQSGRIPPPEKDKFYKDRKNRADRIAAGKEVPKKQPKYSASEIHEARKALDPKYKSKFGPR